jgi:catechol 2,3-dioxygenase-like lactoylglutathione lyase family enzyme
MLKTILIVTISVLNLGPVENAYREHLDYEVVERGAVPADLGEAWAAPGMIGRKYVLMKPESGANVFIRFVENDFVDDYEPMATNGWNATELLVTDPDALAAKLADSPFAIIGPPKDLWEAPNAPRAMQTLGPGNEVLYLTRNGDFPTDTFVDRVFIMVLGGTSMEALGAFYRDKLGLEVGNPMPFPITVVSRAQNRPAETTYPLAIATVSQEFLLELDEYPADTPARTVLPGMLPPGTASVSFEIDGDLDDLELDWLADPREVDSFPYNGRDVGVVVGAAGEWIELVEADDDSDSDSD